VAWDKLIAEPFSEWRNGKGRPWLSGVAQDVGRGLGSAIKGGISAMFGLDASGAIEDGLSIGKSFANGFMSGIEGLDWGKVAEGLKTALQSVVGFIFSNPVTAIPAGAWLGGKAFGGISGVYNTAKGVKGALFGTGADIAGDAFTNSSGIIQGAYASGGGIFRGVSQGMAIAKAAKTGGPATQSALSFAKAGQLGLGARLGASGAGGIALGTAGLAGGLAAGATLISAGSDFYQGSKAENREEAAAYNQSGAWKAGGVAAGAATGAAIGAVFGGIGAVPGALIGAGIGGIAGWVMGDSTKKKYEQSVAEADEAKRALLLAREQAKYSSQELKTALAEAGGSTDDFYRLFQKQIRDSLDKRFGDITLTMSEIESIAQKLTFGEAADSLRDFAGAVSQTQSSLYALEGSAQALKKLNWKIDAGLAAGSPDDETSRTTVEGLITNSQTFLTDKQYEMSAALKILVGDEDAQAYIDRLNTGMDTMRSKLGELSADSSRADIQSEVDSILSTFNGGDSMGALFDFLNITHGGAGMSRQSFEALQATLPEHTAQFQEANNSMLQSGITALQALKSMDDTFDYEGELSKLETAWREKANASIQSVLDYQTTTIASLPGVSDMLNGPLAELSGDTLGAKIQTAIAASLQHGLNWNDLDNPLSEGFQKWADGFGISNDQMGELSGVLKPVAEQMSGGFVSSFEVTAKDSAYMAAGIFQDKVTEAFSQGFDTEAYVRVRPYVEIAADLEADTTPSVTNPSTVTDNPTLNHRLGALGPSTSSAGAASSSSSTENSMINHRMGALGPAHAEGGLFGAYAGGGILDTRGLQPIGSYTESNGVMGSAHVGLVGEDGAEAIIPLTAKRRKRGVSLWQKAGELLGVMPKATGASGIFAAHAEGGLFGAHAGGGIISDAPAAQEDDVVPIVPAITGSGATTGGGGMITAPVTIDNVTFDVKIDSDSAADTERIVAVLKANIKNLTDEIAYSLALSLEQVFANLPIAAREV
jgi:hypothetical protein